MSSLAEKIKIARDQGYKDDEITSYLSTQGMQDKISLAKNQGYKDDEIINYLSQAEQPQPQAEQPQPQEEKPYSWQEAIMDTLVGGGGVARNLPISQRTKQVVGNVAEPTLKGIGMGIGGTVGNVAMPYYGGMAGAGLGQAAGGSIADILNTQLGNKEMPNPQDELMKQLQDVVSGATWEGIGQVSAPILGYAGKGIKKAYNYVTTPFRDEGSKQAALKAYEALTNFQRPISTATEYDKAQEAANNIFRRNVRESMRLGEDLGTKFTEGQASNAPNIILKERALARSVPGGANVDVLKIAEQNKAIEDYLKNEFPGGNIDDLLANIKQKAEGLSKQATGYEDDLTRRLSALKTEKTPYQSGETLRESKYALLMGRKPQVKAKFDRIPNIPVDISPIENKYGEIVSYIKEHPGYEPQDIPSNILDRVKKMLESNKPKISTILDQDENPFISEITEKSKIPFQYLREERNNIYRAIDDFASSVKRKDRLLDLTNELKGSFEQSLKNVSNESPEAGDLYKDAAEYYKKYYLPLKQGVSREMTSKTYGEYRMDTEKIPQKIFNSVTDAKQFMSTLPKSEAKQAMKDYAANNLIGNHVVYNPQTGEINPKGYNAWLQRNVEVLKELGIHKDFNDISKTVTNLEIAKTAKANYDKSIVSKLIGVDSAQAIGNVFSGTSGKSPTGTMHELINRASQTKDPESAVNGLKKAFVDYFEKISEAKTLDAFGNPNPNPIKSREFLQKYDGALKVLFKDQPEKIQALKNVQKGYEIMLRNQRTPFAGGGSPTAEHHFAVIKNRIIKSIPFIGTSYIRLQGFGQQQADTYLMRALYDPEFAYTLTNTIKNPVVFDAKVKGHLIGMGLSGISQQINKEK